MLIEFSVENFKSIKNLSHLNLVAANIKSKYPEIDENNVFKVDDNLNLLKTIALYGGNSSGKTNIVKAMISMMVIVRDVMARPEALQNQIESFYFDGKSDSKPTYFQIQFLLKGKKYRYGFEATEHKIINEWLYGPAETAETYYFEREEGKPIRINKTYFKEGVGLTKKNLKETNLFLNVVEALNGKLSGAIKKYFIRQIIISLGISDTSLRKNTTDMLHSDESKKKLLSFLQLADIGIDDLNEKEDSDEDSARKDKKKNIIGLRPIYNDDGTSTSQVSYNFDQHESLGTIKLFNYAGVILAALRDGCMIMIDEFDARLHPMLTKQIVQMFNSNDINNKGAQLIFVTHDSNLLDNKILRRDQIYFAEKDSKGCTEFYSLTDIKGVRNDASFEKDYFQGKYGAIPYLGDFKTLFDEQ